MYMNENSQPSLGKISVHGDGVGAPTPEMIERRAREIALIDERGPDDFTDADWEQARQELMGVSHTSAGRARDCSRIAGPPRPASGV
ncbi:MAG: hypothetical protein DMF40_03055 [Verrucomicrobia bacterium]|nr:MAG: hypothetical protein DMF40_03055 [Verrucomicrobiota bacterium]